MTRTGAVFGSRASRGIAVVVVGLAIAACSPAASVAPSATAAPVATPSPVPTVAPTPAPTPSPSTATASASAQPDPAIGLKIAAPYELTPLAPALEATLRSQLTQNLGAFGSLVEIGGLTVTKGDQSPGFIFVFGFPAGMMSDAAYQGMVAGIESGMGVTMTTKTVSGVDVAIGSSPTSNLGIFHIGDHVIMALSPTAAEIPAISKALIDANK